MLHNESILVIDDITCERRPAVIHLGYGVCYNTMSCEIARINSSLKGRQIDGKQKVCLLHDVANSAKRSNDIRRSGWNRESHLVQVHLYYNTLHGHCYTTILVNLLVFCEIIFACLWHFWSYRKQEHLGWAIPRSVINERIPLLGELRLHRRQRRRTTSTSCFLNSYMTLKQIYLPLIYKLKYRTQINYTLNIEHQNLSS